MKTTIKQFEQFKAYCLEWQQELGLTDWHLYLYHRDTDDAEADTSYDPAGRGATIRFNTHWDETTPTPNHLKEAALHEMMHILTAPLMTEGQSRYANEDTMRQLEHSIVVRLTNYIMRIKQ